MSKVGRIVFFLLLCSYKNSAFMLDHLSARHNKDPGNSSENWKEHPHSLHGMKNEKNFLDDDDLKTAERKDAV